MVILPSPTGYESGVLSGRYFCAAPGGTSSRVISRHFDQAISAQHIEKVKLGVYAQTGGIYPATILLLCNGVAMARTTAERQAAYRKNRATAGDNGERRINVWVSTATALALQRLARRGAVTQRSVIEELVLAADEQAAASLTEEEWAEYFNVTR